MMRDCGTNGSFQPPDSCTGRMRDSWVMAFTTIHQQLKHLIGAKLLGILDLVWIQLYICYTTCKLIYVFPYKYDIF